MGHHAGYFQRNIWRDGAHANNVCGRGNAKAGRGAMRRDGPPRLQPGAADGQLPVHGPGLPGPIPRGRPPPPQLRHLRRRARGQRDHGTCRSPSRRPHRNGQPCCRRAVGARAAVPAGAGILYWACQFVSMESVCSRWKRVPVQALCCQDRKLGSMSYAAPMCTLPYPTPGGDAAKFIGRLTACDLIRCRCRRGCRK